MSRVLHTSGFLLPPPKYSEALRYPKPDSFTTSSRQLNCQSVVDIGDETYVFSSSAYSPEPAEIPYTNLDSHNHGHGDTFGSRLKINTSKKCNDGKPLSPLEVIPETLASSGEPCGEKTYAQLEVITAGHQGLTAVKAGDTKTEELVKNGCNSRELASQDMCGVGARDGCEGLVEVMGGMNHCKEVTTTKAMPVPINGMITPDKMVVETLLSQMSEINNDSLLVNGDIEDMNGDISELDDFDDDLPPPPREVLEMECSFEPESQAERDLHNLAQALSREGTDRSDSDSGSEHAPLLQQPHDAQSKYPKDTVDEKVDDNIKCKRKVDSDHEYAESGYTDYGNMTYEEDLSYTTNDNAIDTVVYSEPEFSSSDISVKKFGGSPKSAIDMCQRTLKRTNNGMDHTVYELSPSESFCNSADNVQDDSKRLQDHSSNEAICRIGRSSSSLTEPTKKRQPLSRDTSVSFKKPLVVGPRGGERASVRVDMQSPEGEVEPADGEPLVAPNTHNSITSIPSNIIMEDIRTYYKTKAADRGTLYCAAGGITVVAIIVFLLIYFA